MVCAALSGLQSRKAAKRDAGTSGEWLDALCRPESAALRVAPRCPPGASRASTVFPDTLFGPLLADRAPGCDAGRDRGEKCGPSGIKRYSRDDPHARLAQPPPPPVPLPPEGGGGTLAAPAFSPSPPHRGGEGRGEEGVFFLALRCVILVSGARTAGLTRTCAIAPGRRAGRWARAGVPCPAASAPHRARRCTRHRPARPARPARP